MPPPCSCWLASLLTRQEVCCLRPLADPASLVDWRCSCSCSGLIPSVTEKSVIFVKELSFPHTAPTDDTFFQPDWARECGGRWAGPRLLLGWSAGTGVPLLYKNKKEEGPAGASPLAAPMPKSVSF